MLTRHAKAYSSSCSQIALDLVYLQPFRRNSLLKCAAQPKICKKMKLFIFGVQGFSVIDVDTTKTRHIGLVVIGRA